MDILNELYLGRAPVEPLRKQIAIVRAKFRNQHITPTTNQDPEILKFNRLVESIFGFHSFALYIQPDNIPNAYTFPVDNYYTEEDKVKIIKSLTASPTGFKYREAIEGLSAIIAINIGLINLDEVTDDEIMATCLHEIGHCFFEAVTNPDNAYTSSRKLSSILLTVNKCALDKIKKGKQITIDAVNRDIDTFASSIKSIKKSFFHLKKKIFRESMEDNMKKNRIAYTNEKFADNFAAMYGYGEECGSVDVKITSAIHKMVGGKPVKYPKLFETILMYNRYFEDLLQYIFNLQNEHPENLARMKTTADYLKREISKEGIDPVVKRELIAELNKVNQLIDQYRNFPKDQDSMRIARLYQNKLYEKFGGDRREKDTDNSALFDFIDSRYNALRGDGIDESNLDEPILDTEIIEASNYTDIDLYLDTFCGSADCYNESVIDDFKDKVISVKDLWDQWKKSTKSFVKHKWIYRYVNDKQKAQLEKHYEVLKNQDTNYSTYKRSFAAICKFVGLPTDTIILENVIFKKDDVDKEMNIMAVKYSKGKVKVTIPDGVKLIHTHVANDGVKIDNLIPAFRSKTVGKYMYPSKRCFFTCIKPINNNKAGMKGAVNKYTPKQPITTAYIDPTYPDFGSNSVYVETDIPIPMENYKTSLEKTMLNLKSKMNSNNDKK